MRLVHAPIFSLLMLGISCATPAVKPDIHSNDPGLKIPAIKHAAQAGDRSAIPEMVKSLRSDDPAIRLYAIEALHQFTGNRMGYHYYDESSTRDAAIERWEAWLKEQFPAAQPAAGTK